MIDLHAYDHIVINSSGGKDSQTMIRQVVRLADAQGFDRSRISVVHADLGRVEWEGTKALAELQAKHYDLEFIVVQREKGDLLDQVLDRGMWPSSSTRFCTSDQKRDQVAKVFTRLQRERGVKGQPFRILNCMGLRAAESSARAKRAEFEDNRRVSTKTRTVTNWHPILSWSDEDVWNDIRESGVPYHPAYDLGMPRLSCVFCIFAPRPALILAGKHNPELLDVYVAIEERIGHTFTKNVSMREIKEAVVRGESPEITSGGTICGSWTM